MLTDWAPTAAVTMVLPERLATSVPFPEKSATCLFEDAQDAPSRLTANNFESPTRITGARLVKASFSSALAVRSQYTTPAAISKRNRTAIPADRTILLLNILFYSSGGSSISAMGRLIFFVELLRNGYWRTTSPVSARYVGWLLLNSSNTF